MASVDLRAANAVGEQLCALSLRVTVFRDRDAGPDRFAESEVVDLFDLCAAEHLAQVGVRFVVPFADVQMCIRDRCRPL